MMSWWQAEKNGDHFACGARTNWSIAKARVGDFFEIDALSPDAVIECVAVADDLDNAQLLAEALDEVDAGADKRLGTMLSEAGFERIVIDAMYDDVVWMKLEGKASFKLSLQPKGVSILYHDGDSVSAERIGMVHLPVATQRSRRPMRAALAACLQVIELRYTPETVA